uniref:EF-hand domain-containing protein n=1 Tax=Lynx canadensis TaxID=61383 RepID=A0A667ICA0_LYNCA
MANTKTTKKHPQRAKSNMFAMSDQSQTQKFKEAFNVIDQNRDGFIVKEDLHDMLASLGKNPTDDNWRGKDRDLTPSESRGLSWNDTEGQSQLCSRPRGQQFGLNQGDKRAPGEEFLKIKVEPTIFDPVDMQFSL